MIPYPPEDFATNGNSDPSVHELIVTPEVQSWARDAVEQLGAAGWYVPPDLLLVRDGHTLVRRRWWWLLNDVLSPRRKTPPPF